MLEIAQDFPANGHIIQTEELQERKGSASFTVIWRLVECQFSHIVAPRSSYMRQEVWSVSLTNRSTDFDLWVVETWRAVRRRKATGRRNRRAKGNENISNGRHSSSDRESTYTTIEIFHAGSIMEIDESMQISTDERLSIKVMWVLQRIWIGVIDSARFQTKPKESEHQHHLGHPLPRRWRHALVRLSMRRANTEWTRLVRITNQQLLTIPFR